MQYSKPEKNNSVKTDSDKVTQMYSDGGGKYIFQM